MDINKMFFDSEEKPLDTMPSDGGFVGIFRTIACVGDSLSSGEFEAVGEDGNIKYLDMYDYSWGQYMARAVGCKVYNFSCGGMTARRYPNFAEEQGFWDLALAAQAYIFALGVNDVICQPQPVGSIADIDPTDWHNNNRETFAGCFAAVMQRYCEIQPKAKLFLVTMPRSQGDDEEKNRIADAHAALMHELAALFPRTYVIDLRKYAPVYDEAFEAKFYLFHHQNPMGYILTAKMMVSYIDYIIRHNMKDFIQASLIGTPHYMESLENKA